jgi:hypothetical protein
VPADPLSRRLLQLAGLLAVLLIAVVVNYLLHNGAETLNPVAEAAQRTAAMPGARIRMEITYEVEGGSRSISGTGTGAFDARTGLTWVDFTLPIPGQATVTARSVGDERTTYVRSSTLASELPAGKEWLGMEPLLGHDPSKAFGAGPGAESTIDMLKAAGGDVEEVDHQSVGGHPTTHYKATIDLARVAELLTERGEAALAHQYEVEAEEEPDPIPVEVWVDGHGLARLVRMLLPLPSAAGGPTVTMDMRMEFFDFGVRPKVKLPPKRRVLDYTPVLRAELGMVDGSTVGKLAPPAAAEPLAVGDFRRRADDVCRALVRKAKPLILAAPRTVEAIKAAGEVQDLAQVRALAQDYGVRIGERIYRLARRGTHELARLVPPRRYASEFRRYLAMQARSDEWLLAGSRALELGAYKSPAVQRGQSGKAEDSRLEALASSLGLKTCAQSAGPGDPSGQLE